MYWRHFEFFRSDLKFEVWQQNLDNYSLEIWMQIKSDGRRCCYRSFTVSVFFRWYPFRNCAVSKYNCALYNICSLIQFSSFVKFESDSSSLSKSSLSKSSLSETPGFWWGCLQIHQQRSQLRIAWKALNSGWPSSAKYSSPGLRKPLNEQILRCVSEKPYFAGRFIFWSLWQDGQGSCYRGVVLSRFCCSKRQKEQFSRSCLFFRHSHAFAGQERKRV
jgi:hypothetical protein